MNQSKRAILVALLCLSSVILLATVLTPVLAEIGKSFPDASTTAVQMVFTVVSLVSLPVMLLAGSLTARVSKKSLCGLGLCLIVLGGALPLFLNSALWMLYLAGVLIGGGIAFVNVLSSSLISDHFKGIEKGRVMGYQSAALSLSGAVCSLFSGRIAAVAQWKWIYALFFAALPILLLFWRLMPNDRPVRRAERIGPAYSRGLVIWALLGFCWSLFMYAFNTNISMFIEEAGFGDSEVSGFVTALFLFVGIPGGLALGPCMKLLGKNVVAVMCFLMAGGMLCVAFAESLFMLYAGALLFGLGFAVRSPAVIAFTAYMAPQEGSAPAIALVNAFGTVAGFLSPFVVNAVSGLFGGTFRVTFIVCGIALAAVSAAYSLLNPVKQEMLSAN